MAVTLYWIHGKVNLECLMIYVEIVKSAQILSTIIDCLRKL